MSNRLLEVNQQKLGNEPNAVERIRLLQDRAVLQARLGRTDEALRTLDAARQAAPVGLPIPLALRFDYVHAIARYFSKHFAEARSKMHEVLEQAACHPDVGLISECESALALFLQREGDVRGAARHARAVLARSESSLESRYRATLALASLHQDARDYEEAIRLYRETREVVRDLGDDIAMASWMQRSALSQASHVRQAAAYDELDTGTLNDAVAALEESIEYARKLADAPDIGLNHLLLAEMRVLQKRYRDAIAMYDAHLPAAEGDGFLHEVTAAMADRSHCLLKLGDGDGAYSQAAAALHRVDESTPADIRAIVHENMSSALRNNGHRIEAEQHRVLARMAWETYGHEQREARRLLHEQSGETLH